MVLIKRFARGGKKKGGGGALGGSLTGVQDADGLEDGTDQVARVECEDPNGGTGHAEDGLHRER